MEKEYFDSLIDSVYEEIKECFEEFKNNEDNKELHTLLLGRWMIADTIKNRIDIQNEVNDTEEYLEYVNLINEIEKYLN